MGVSTITYCKWSVCHGFAGWFLVRSLIHLCLIRTARRNVQSASHHIVHGLARIQYRAQTRTLQNPTPRSRSKAGRGPTWTIAKIHKRQQTGVRRTNKQLKAQDREIMVAGRYGVYDVRVGNGGEGRNLRDVNAS